MIYLTLVTRDDFGSAIVSIAACEDDAHAARREAQGYERCSRELFIAEWRERDMARYQMMGMMDWIERQRRRPPPVQARAVGDAPGVPGMTLYYTDGR